MRRWSTASAVLTTMLHGLMAQGRWRDEAGVNFSDTGSPFYEVYECADGRFVAVGAIERPFYVALLDGLGLDEAELPDRRDPATWPELKKRFAEIFATRSRDEWAKHFEGSDACVAPVLSLTEAPHHPQNVDAQDVRRAWRGPAAIPSAALLPNAICARAHAARSG